MDDPSAAWNESSKAPSVGKSVSYADDVVQRKPRSPSITDDDSDSDDGGGGDESDAVGAAILRLPTKKTIKKLLSTAATL